MADLTLRLVKGSPLTNAEVDANFSSLNEAITVGGEPMGHEDRTTSTISFNASTRTFTIAPVSGSFVVWCKGEKVVVSSAQTVVIPNTTGMHSIYYDENGTLSSKLGYFTFSTEAPTAYVYWNATTGAAPYFGDERHGVVLDWQTHEYLHRTRGAAIANGFLASGYTLDSSATDADTQIAIESGTFFDEDMKIDIVSTATPTAGTYQQNLLFPAKIPVLHLQGTSWVMDAPTNFPFKQGTSRPQYNSLSGGVWSTTDVGNHQHATTWILATNNLTYPVIAIIGQSATDNQGEAEAFSFADLTLTGFPSVEFRPLYKLIYKASDNYANNVNAQLVSIVDLRSISAVGSAANPATDHGNLSGLSDDDHPQYLSVDTVRSPSAAVKNSFLPAQSSNNGKFLTTDGTNPSWATMTAPNNGALTLAVSGTGLSGSASFTADQAGNSTFTVTSNATSANTSGAIVARDGSGNFSANVITAVSFTGSASGLTGLKTVNGNSILGSGNIQIDGGVTSFNTRTGAITLSSGDVTGALGFTPYNSTNPNGYTTNVGTVVGVTAGTGLTGGTVTSSGTIALATSGVTAGTYTKLTVDAYGRATVGASLSSGDVTGALGFTPYNSTNPSGYITSSALSSYLPLSGGTLSSTVDGILTLNKTSGTAWNYVNFSYAGTRRFYFGLNSAYEPELGVDNGGTFRVNGAMTIGGSTVLHAGNYNSYSPSLTGSGAAGTWNINVTGNAESATGANRLNSDTGSKGSALQYWQTYGNTTLNPNDNWHYAIRMSHGDAETYYSATLALDFSDDVFQFRRKTNGVNQNWRTLLHSGNYNSYSPTLTGGNASGTWGINVTGNSGTTTVLRSSYAGDAGDLNTAGTGIIYNYNTVGAWTNAPSGMSYGSVYHLGGSAGGGTLSLQIAADINHNSTSSTKQLWFRTSNNLGFQNDWKELLHSGNYSSYALPLSGGTVSGYTTFSADVNMTSTSSYLPGHFYTNTWDGTNVYFHVGGSSSTTNKILNLRVMNNSGGNSLYQFDVNRLDAPNLQINGNQVLHAGNSQNYRSRSLNSARTINVDFNSLNTAVDTFTAGTNYIPSGGAYNQPADGDHHYLSWGGIEGAAQWAAQLDIDFYTDRVWFRRQYSTSWQAWRQFIHDGNYSSYALPLSGGTLSGNLNISPGGSSLNLTGAASRISFRDADLSWTGYVGYTGNIGQIDFSGRNVEVLSGWNGTISLLTGTSGYNSGTVAIPWGNLTVQGNIGLHAGNYSSYALPLSGGTVTGPTYISTGGNYPLQLISTQRYMLQIRNPNNSVNSGYGWWFATDTNFNFAMHADGLGDVLTLTRSGALTLNGNAVLHASNYSSYALPLGGGSIAYLGINNASAINLRGAGSGTYNTSWIYSDTTINSWEAPKTTDSAGGARVPFILTWRGGYGSEGGLRLTGGASGELGGNTILHAGNYNSYALGIFGDTFTINDWNGLTAFGSRRTAPDGADANGPPINQYGNLLVFGHSNGVTQLQAGHDGRLAWRTKWNASDWTGWSVALDSGNYSSYALPLSGGVLSGAVRGTQLTLGGGTNTDANFGVQGTSHFAGGTVYWGGTVGNVNSWSSQQTSSAGTHTLNASRFVVDRYGYGSQPLIDAQLGSIGLGQYTTIASGARVDGGIRQGNNLARPLAEWSTGGSSTGMVYIEMPGSTSNYGMVHAVIDVYEYNSNAAATIIVGGHNWVSSWYNVSCNVIGATNKQVRLAVRNGKFVICLGDASSVWEYGTVMLRKIHNASFYNNVMDMGAPFVIAQTNSEGLSGSSGDLRALRTPSSFNANGAITQAGNQVLHAGNYSSYALPLSGGTITGNQTITGTLTVSSGNATGGGIILADDGDIVDLNDAYCSMRFTSGVRVFSANRGGSAVHTLHSNGTFTASGNITAYSDERLKKDWSPLANGFVERLAAVKHGTYTRIDNNKRQAGSSAQDWQQLLPEVVTEADNEEKTLSLAYGNAALVSAIELAKDNLELRARIERLEALVEKLIGD